MLIIVYNKDNGYPMHGNGYLSGKAFDVQGVPKKPKTIEITYC